jgi:hypothetical protein
MFKRFSPLAKIRNVAFPFSVIPLHGKPKSFAGSTVAAFSNFLASSPPYEVEAPRRHAHANYSSSNMFGWHTIALSVPKQNLAPVATAK